MRDWPARFLRTLAAVVTDRPVFDGPIASATADVSIAARYLTPLGLFVAVILVGSVLVRIGTIYDPLGNPGWPMPLPWIGMATILAFVVTVLATPATSFALALLVSGFGRRIGFGTAFRICLYHVATMVFIQLAIVAAVFGLIGLSGLYMPNMSAAILFGGIILAQIGTIWLLARRLYRLSGASRWATWLLSIIALVVVGLSPLGSPKEYGLIPIGSWSIKSESMAPTIMAGDVLISESWTRTDQLRRGEIVVIAPPGRPQPHVVRLIGIGGDKVRYLGGTLWLNDQQVPREFLEERSIPAPGGRNVSLRVFREVIDGHSHLIGDLVDNSAGDNTREFLVPDGHIFVLGDNRDNSADSRFGSSGGYGMPPASVIIGRVYHRSHPNPGPVQ